MTSESENQLNGYIPGEEQELLLQAALLQGKQALRAWEKWRSRVDVEALDYSSYKLLPLLYRNLSKQSVRDPLVDRFKGVYRKTWYKNRMLFRDLESVLSLFHQNGIPTLILKGAALTLCHYRDYGMRPMDDMDILVPSRQAAAAVRLLSDSGWMPKERIRKIYHTGYFSYRHAYIFKNTGGRFMDLHGHVLFECCTRRGDDEFWSGAVSVTLSDTLQTQALNPSDQLLHVLVHGLQGGGELVLRWVADAVMILDTSPELDWDRLVRQAEKRQVIRPVMTGLDYLAKRMRQPVPAPALDELFRLPVSRLEYRDIRIRHHKDTLSPVVTIRQIWWHFCRKKSGVSLLFRVIAFPKYLQVSWELPSLFLVPLAAVGKTMRKIFDQSG